MSAMPGYLRTLFLHPPSFEGFDGGAGSRYQARREVRSFWYPTWLAQPAALVPGSRLVDAPPAGLGLADVLPLARDYDLAVLHTSAPSFAHDVRVAEALREANPRLRVGFVGAHAAVAREAALHASKAIEFVAGNEFDFTIQELAEGRPPARVAGLSYRTNGHVHRTPERAPLEDMDRGLVIPIRRWPDYLTLSVTEIREYGDTSIQVVRRLRAMLEELSEAVLPERRSAVLRELERLDRTVALTWGETVDIDLASRSDRQGVGGPSATEAS